MNDTVTWLDQHNVNILTVGATVAILITAFIAILILSRLLHRWLAYLQVRLRLTFDTTVMITRLITSILWFITVIFILSIWGVSVGGLWTLLVSTATIIGVGFLATWTMISNFTASFFLTLWRPFHLGQTVEILPENLRGRMTDRDLMFTTLREESGSILQIPNNLFFQKPFRVSGEPASSWSDSHEKVRAPSLAQS